jgi:hypothetical protein
VRSPRPRAHAHSFPVTTVFWTRSAASLMHAPEAAVAEYAIAESPELGNSCLIVPLSDDSWLRWCARA